MAEFCLECFNRINGKNFSGKKYIISDYLDLCEGCGEFKPVIISSRKTYYAYKFRFLLFPFKVIYKVIHFIFKVVFLPYLIYKRNKVKAKYK